MDIAAEWARGGEGGREGGEEDGKGEGRRKGKREGRRKGGRKGRRGEGERTKVSLQVVISRLIPLTQLHESDTNIKV